MQRPALARLYRPRSFSEIVGQDHVAGTLRTAVERGRVAHAYLFCGPRGIGKTTAARVLAMALNCQNREGGEPCGTCESCERIWSGRTSLDVVEIDAASNRGVEDARDLRERAMYAPSEESRYKVYIIDEAHMLTREAWNAFLKILEEPPPRVIFVLATTEPGKILQAAPPILSRCQRFDFRRITADKIRARLEWVLGAEDVEAEDGALETIVQKADGALRDALSALDQVLAFSGDSVAAEDVRQVLGLIEDELYLELFDILGDRRAAEVFSYVERLVEGGYDLEEFYKGLGERLRTLLRLGLEDESRLESLDSRSSSRYRELTRRFTTGDLLRMLSGLAELDTDGRFRKSEQQRILIEVLLLKFAMLDRTIELERLIEAAGGEATEKPNPSSGSRGRSPERKSVRDEGVSSRAPPTEKKRKSEESGAGNSGDSQTRARAAWQESITGGAVLRPGQGIALRAAQVKELSSDGTLWISVAAKTPGSELLADLVTRRRLEEELSRRLGSPIRIRVASEEEVQQPRVTEERSRQQRLDRLVDSDHGLRELVERLDLELID